MSNNNQTAAAAQQRFEVLRTKEYHLFSHLDGNRSLSKAHLQRLTESMNEKLLVSPIIVNNKYQIIDGQHRFEACKQLGLPVLYIMVKGYGLEEVQRFNSNQKNFAYEDFVNGYCDLGNEDYKTLRDFKEMFKFDWGTCMAMLSGNAARGGGQGLQDFRDGKFKVRDLNKAKAIAQKIEELGRFYHNYKRRYFIAAAMRMMKTPGYEQKQMLDKLRYLSAKLVDCATTEDYLKLLEMIYNYKTRTQTLRFL